MMDTMSQSTAPQRFADFAATAEPRLRRVLVAWYGVDIGAEVTADAMAVAWERWSEIESMANPTGYLFRVAQSRSRRYRRRPVALPAISSVELPDVDPRLPSALANLTAQQRAAVLLVHAHGWTYAEAAEVLECSVSTLRNHLDRGMRKLRASLGDDHA
jgi:RNA polymerase sigma factor (sigma-70 family)